MQLDFTLAQTAPPGGSVIRSPPVMNIAKGVRADIALILITIIWGISFTLVKKSLIQASPIAFIVLRFWVATAVTFLCMPRSVLNISRHTLRRGLTLALLLVGGFLFQTLGLRTTTPSKSAFITSLSVLLVPLLGFILFRYRPRTQTLAGVTIATAGLALLTLERMELAFSQGDTMTLICAAVFALHILFLGRYLPGGDYRQLFMLQMAGSAAISSIMLPVLEDKPFLIWDLTFAVYLAVVGVLATALAFYIQNWAQQFTTPNRAALIFSLEPFFATLSAFLLLGQRMTAREWAGGVLVMAGVLVAEYRRAARGSATQERPAPAAAPPGPRGQKPDEPA